MKKTFIELAGLIVLIVAIYYASSIWKYYLDLLYYKNDWPEISERIGVDIVRNPDMPIYDRWVFTEPEPGSPAELAGIEEGDLLYEYTFKKFIKEFWYGNDDGNVYFDVHRGADSDPETLKDGTVIRITLPYTY